MSSSSFLCLTILIITFTLFTFIHARERLSEPERVEQWHRLHTWPPKWHEESEGYRQLMETREREIMAIPGADERWENWMQYIQARYVRSFTEVGFEVIQTPKHLHAKMKAYIDERVKDWENLPYENGVESSIYAPNPPKMVWLGEIAQEVHNALLPLHEAWAGGIKLRPTSAYGVRLYQNGSTIVMHNDKPQTHVISSIIHITHQYDDNNEPWHIQIEDHDGNLHSVALEEGQMMFYESSKCLHGRMHLLKGKYYGSLFIHYQPVSKKVWNVNIDDIIDAVPPHWKDGVVEDHGSRWAGQAITTDSRVVDNAPPRIVGNDIIREREEVQDFYQDFPDEDQEVFEEQVPEEPEGVFLEEL